MGSFGLNAANAEVGAADVVLAVGTKLGPTDTCGENPDVLDPSRQEIIQIEIEPRNAPWTFPARALIGDAAPTLTALSDKIGELPPADRAPGADRVRAAASLGTFDTAASQSAELPILPQRVVHELAQRLPENAVVTCDAGENRLFMSHHYRTRSVRGFVMAAGIGGMGYAIPAALGAKLAEPHRLVVAVCGDGGYAMTFNGLMTAIEENIPIVVVILNNQMLGWVRHDRGEHIPSEFHDFDLSAIAAAMGCQGFKVSTFEELETALDAAVEAEATTTVIDVRTARDQTFLSCRSSFANKAWKPLI